MYRKVLNIIDSPNELRKKSLCFPDFENWTTKDSECINDLTDTFEVIQGLGLAAPQIGILKRAIILNQRQLGISEDQEHLVMINPVLKLSGPTERNKEACFSVPHADGFVERHQVCEVSYIDKSGKQKSLTAEGYAAVCIQHEVDHLDGKLYIDRMGPLSRKMLLKKVQKANKRKVEAARLAKEAFDRDHRDVMGDETSRKKTTYSKKRKPKARKKRQKKSKKR